MDIDNQKKKYCADDDEYRLHWDICEKFARVRCYYSHLKSQSHKNIICERTTFKSIFKEYSNYKLKPYFIWNRT